MGWRHRSRTRKPPRSGAGNGAGNGLSSATNSLTPTLTCGKSTVGRVVVKHAYRDESMESLCTTSGCEPFRVHVLDLQAGYAKSSIWKTTGWMLSGRRPGIDTKTCVVQHSSFQMTRWDFVTRGWWPHRDQRCPAGPATRRKVVFEASSPSKPEG